MTLKIEGSEEVAALLKRYGQKAEKMITEAVEATAREIETTAKQSILRGTKSGITYTRAPGQNLSATHTASAPGQAPANDSGTLQSNINIELQGTTAKIGVGSSVEYAAALEFGTRNMKPRPFMAPALNANTAKFIKRLSAIPGKIK